MSIPANARRALSGNRSLWLDGPTPVLGHPLDRDIAVDVAVIGGGIAGVTTALLLQRLGAQVALLEGQRIASGATGYTTAKVSALQQTGYSTIQRFHGAEGAQAYATASTAAVERIAAFVDEGIECGWKRIAAFTYAATDADADAVRDEAAAAHRAGLPVELTEVEVSFPLALAVRLAGQGEFDPTRYVRGLASRLLAEGGLICEETSVGGVHEGSPCRVATSTGSTVTARDVVVCTNYPLLDRGLYFARTGAMRSYLVAARVTEPGPAGMFISAGEPTRSVRPYTAPDGAHWVLVGGEGHATGSGDARPQRYHALEHFAREHFEVADIPFRWSTQDAAAVDRLPYAGRYSAVSSHLFVNAAGHKWGMTNGTIGAMVLADRFAGRRHPQADLFDPSRIALRSVPALAKAQLQVGSHFITDRLRPTESGDAIAAGEARVVRDGLGRTGVYRDAAGAVHAVSLRCTHLGCLLRFNHAEHSWDCPCHGSRFDADGAVLAGPATMPLEPREPPAEG